MITSSNEEWARVRNSSAAYPQASFSLFNGTMEGMEVTGWVNMGYKQYQYKKFCPNYLHIEVDMSDSSHPQFEKLDLDTIEEFFLEGLQKLCVSHMVARMLVGQDVVISMYVEDMEVVGQFLDNTSLADDRPFNFGFSIEEDDGWEEVVLPLIK